ncbi:MAG: rod shape-determining protein MreD [Planctomycetaceae bacterium]
MKAFPYLIAVYAALVLETMGVGATSAGIEPGWLFLTAALGAWVFPPAVSVLFAGGIGLLLDSLTASPMGLYVTTLGTLVWMAGMLKQRFRVTSLTGFFLLTFLVSGGAYGVVTLLRSLPIVPQSFDWKAWSLATTAQGAATALTGLILFSIFYSLFWFIKNVLLAPLRLRPGVSSHS